MNYDKLEACIFVPREAVAYESDEDNLAYVRTQLAHQIADELVTSYFGDVEENYNIESEGYFYTLSIRIRPYRRPAK